MQCTREEIEEKRRIAQEKLARKYSSPTKSPFKFRETVKHQEKPYEKPTEKTSNFYGTDKVINGTCSLISEERFQVELNGFSAQAIEIFKTIPSRNYNPKTRIWDFHVKEYQFLWSKLQNLKGNLMLEPIPNFVLNCVNQPKTNEIEPNFDEIDRELFDSLMPFQLDGVRFGIERHGRCFIADDMGLGKTFQALAIAHYYHSDWPLLIVTTSSMKTQWEETIHKYLPSVPLMYCQYMMSGRDFIGDARILIVSHDLMTRCLEKLQTRNFGVLIFDESHNLKNSKAKCTKAATKLAQTAKRIVLLSGTPALSRPSELYSQLQMLDPKFFGNFFSYSKRYCNGKSTNFGWDAGGKSNLQELEIVLNRKFMIRRTKESVLRHLPNKVQEIVKLDVKLNEISEQDRSCLKSLALEYENEHTKLNKHAILLNFFQETAKIKIPSVCSYIMKLLENGEKFIIFAHHQKMLNALGLVLDNKSVSHIRIDGHTNSEQRKRLVDKFQLDDNCKVALLSITAANAGITLTSANLVVFAELHWNPSILSQAESRAHRIGQEKPVKVSYLIAPQTADEPIWALLQRKQKILQEIGLSKDSFQNVTIADQGTSSCPNRITSYFPSTSRKMEDSDFFNDGFDDILSNINM